MRIMQIWAVLIRTASKEYTKIFAHRCMQTDVTQNWLVLCETVTLWSTAVVPTSLKQKTACVLHKLSH